MKAESGKTFNITLQQPTGFLGAEAPKQRLKGEGVCKGREGNFALIKVSLSPLHKTISTLQFIANKKNRG